MTEIDYTLKLYELYQSMTPDQKRGLAKAVHAVADGELDIQTKAGQRAFKRMMAAKPRVTRRPVARS